MSLPDKPTITIANSCSALFPATAGPYLYLIAMHTMILKTMPSTAHPVFVVKGNSHTVSPSVRGKTGKRQKEGRDRKKKEAGDGEITG